MRTEETMVDVGLIMKIFGDPEIEAAILCGRSIDSAIQDYLEKHPLSAEMLEKWGNR